MTSLFLLLVALGEACVGIKGFYDPMFRQDALHMTYNLATPLVFAFCAVFLFAGANWARIFFYVVCLPLIMLGSLVGIRLVVFGLCAWRLAAWPANFFFTGNDTRKNPPDRPRNREDISQPHRRRYDY